MDPKNQKYAFPDLDGTREARQVQSLGTERTGSPGRRTTAARAEGKAIA